MALVPRIIAHDQKLPNEPLLILLIFITFSLH